MALTDKPIHANALVFNASGLLIIGQSGSGKSDLSLRLIDAGGTLISDDYTILTSDDTQSLYASPPNKIAGLLEIRGIGIVTVPYLEKHKIDCVIELVTEYPRLPENVYATYQGVSLRKFFLNPFELSVLNKINYITKSYTHNKTI
jgi:serine kinase of HPr protein (carbohydrate metabolism regulator)